MLVDLYLRGKGLVENTHTVDSGSDASNIYGLQSFKQLYTATSSVYSVVYTRGTNQIVWLY